jgi:hypothetical protein
MVGGDNVTLEVHVHTCSLHAKHPLLKTECKQISIKLKISSNYNQQFVSCYMQTAGHDKANKHIF